MPAIEPDIEEKVLNSVQKFENFDWNIEEAKIKAKKPEFAFNTIVTMGYAYDLKKDLDKRREDISPDLIKMIEAGISYTALDIAKAEAQRQELFEIFYDYFKSFDILITPTTPVPAFDLGMTSVPKIAGKAVSFTYWMSYTYPFNMTGLPAASIPCGWTENGLPIGMQIVGKRYDEKTVLQVSKAFEEVAPWQDKRPKFD